jgi:aryl carrier-like protein
MRRAFSLTTLKNKHMNKEEIKALLTLQASVHQMLIISKDRLPNDEELIQSIMDSVRFVQRNKNMTIDEETIITLCHLAINVRETLNNPEQYIMKMIKEML